MKISGAEFSAMFTPLLLTVLLLGGVILELTAWRKYPRRMGIFVLLGLGLIFLLQVQFQVFRFNVKGEGAIAFGGTFFFDRFSCYFNYLFLLAAGVAVLLSLTHWRERQDQRGEYYLLMIAATIGMCLMAATHDLLVLFVGLELMSIPVYVLVAMERDNVKSSEAGLKYLLLGAFGSAILLFGLALFYGLAGRLDYESVATGITKVLNYSWEVVQTPASPREEPEAFSLFKLMGRTGQLAAEKPDLAAQLYMMLFGVAFVLAGFFFKVAAVPFHMWTPDVYEGAPTPITAYMATGVKAAAFAALVRIGITFWGPLWGLIPFYYILATVSILTMCLGNFAALAQQNLKRMLAYSSIAHAGYLLVGFTAIIAAGQFYELDIMSYETVARLGFATAKPILFYLFAYTLMNLGAFGVIVVLSADQADAEYLSDFRGLSRRHPGLAGAMAVCMLSLAGIPPLAGFTAKFYLFEAAVANRLYLLTVIGVLNSVLSAYYYLRVLVIMYMEPAPDTAPAAGASRQSGAMAAVILMAVLVVLLGIFPETILQLLEQSISLDMLQLPLH